MARSPRPHLRNIVYHLTVRGNNRQPLFRDGDDRRHYLELLDRYRERFGCLIYAYTLLSNRLHLLLETPRGNVSRFMQCLGTSYAVYFNRRYKRRGTLFEGRFKSQLVAKRDLQELTRHLHCDCLNKDLKKQWRDYPWSSCRIYLGLQKSNLVETRTVLDALGDTWGEQVSKYESLMKQDGKKGQRFKEVTSFELEKSGKALFPWVSRTVDGREQASDLRKAKDILRGVTRSLGLRDLKDLAGRRRMGFERHLAMYLIRKHTPLPLRSIAELLGVKPAAVANGVGNVEKLVRQGAFPGHLADLLRELDGKARLGV